MEMTPIDALGMTLFERIRVCGLVRVSVAFLEEVCYCGWPLRFQNPNGAQCHSLFLLPADPDVESQRLLQHHVCPHATMLPAMVTDET